MITRRRTVAPAVSIASDVISISRRAAFGDVICATVIADAVARMGFKVKFNTLETIKGVLGYHQSIHSFGHPSDPFHVNLDNSYEVDKARGERLAMSYFYEIAANSLRGYGINLRPECNLRPQLNILPDEVEAMRHLLHPFVRPWVVVVPKSNHFTNRTVPHSTWSQAACNTHGTMLWSGTDRINSNIVDMNCKSMRQVAALMAAADLVVGVDTGPMWCAVGVNTPILGVSQARAFRILMNDQVDWQDVSPELHCIGCSEYKCPIDEVRPPCQSIMPSVISSAVNARLETVTGTRVSVVIPCLHDRHPRVLRCLAAVLDQADEVIFSLDGKANGELIPKHSKVKIIRAPKGQQTGFGKTCNRGARHSTGRFIVFLNDDLYLDPGALRSMKLEITNGKVGAVGGLWRYPDGKIQHGGGHRHTGDAGFGHRDWGKKTPSIVVPTEMEFVTAACMMVRREAFFEVGAFGEEFGNYSEDSDLCMKLRQKGWKIMYQPAATGIHEESQTTSESKMVMLRAANVVFREKWQRYFTHNPSDRLGVFA